jgi:hypothetical protein
MEAILDFSRGRQNWLKSCYAECVGGGGGGNEARAAASVIASGWGGGVEVALQLFAPHILHSAVKASFHIKKACGKPYNT